MSLCPSCFNPPAGCECDPPYTEAEARSAPRKLIHKTSWAESLGFMTIDEAAGRAPESGRPLVRAVLQELDRLGCRIEIPDAEDQNYANIRPKVPGSPRVCALTLTTGRFEFQEESYTAAQRLHVEGSFDRLVGEKAAISLVSPQQVDDTIALAQAYVPKRRG